MKMEKPAKTDYPIHELLRKRWSPRAFDSRPIEPAKLKSILEAARWAPSSYNEQPWALIVATKDQATDFARILDCFVDFNKGWASGAPVVMLTVSHKTFDKNGNENRHAFHDVGLMMANLSVQATAEGIAVHQMAGILPDKAKELFGIPDGWEALTGVALGYPGDPNSLPDQLRQRELEERTRKPLASFVFTSGFGKPSPLLK
jgi:nitroreductase